MDLAVLSKDHTATVLSIRATRPPGPDTPRYWTQPNFDRMQPMIDGVLQRGVRNQSSRVHQLFEKWQSLSSVNRSEAEAGFLADLTPMALRFSPDLALGVGDAERMALTYGLASEPRLGEFVVRFIDGYGPELAP